MRLQLLCIATLIAAPGLRAAEEVRSVQEELRRRNLYFGDIDGRRTPELEQAVKRYQKKKGISASGQDDRETLRSLGLVQRAPDEPLPKAVSWPSEPVLKSDAMIDVDREAVRIAEETGVAPEAVGAGAAADESPTSPRSAVRKVALKRTASTAAAAQPSAPAAPQRRSFSRRKRGQDQQVEPAEIRQYVNEYLRAMSSGKVDEELEFYADRVAYYGNGVIDRRIVERTLRDYYKRWPKRKYKLGPAVEFARRPDTGEILVVFRVEFSLKNGRQQVRGQTVNQFLINAGTSDPRIVSVREERVRS